MVKTYPLESISLEQAMEKQFRLVDTACRFFTGTEILSLGDLGVVPGLNKPHTTLKVEQTLSAFFGTEKPCSCGAPAPAHPVCAAGGLCARPAGAGARRAAVSHHGIHLPHDGPAGGPGGFQRRRRAGKVLAEHPQVQTTLVQLARQKIDDRYDFTQVVARLKEHGLTVITDDNYAVMKLPRIGCEAGSDVSCFPPSSFWALKGSALSPARPIWWTASSPCTIPAACRCRATRRWRCCAA